MKEAKTVLHTKSEIDGAEQEVLIMPITRLDCIEDTADIKNTAEAADYIPIIDSMDNGQMKKLSAANLLTKAEQALDTANTASQAAQNAATAASEAKQAAQAAASAAESAVQQTSSAQPAPFTVDISAWTASSDSNFPFKAEITASGVTANDSADVRFDKSSIKAASSAGVLTGETAAGKIILYAEKTPTAALGGVYIISKGAVE